MKCPFLHDPLPSLKLQADPTELVALGLVSCTLIAVLLIATTTEEKSTKLLRKLRISRRLSSRECDLLRPPNPKTAKLNSLPPPPPGCFLVPNKEILLLRRLLLEGRISASELEILHAAHTESVTLSWRRTAKDKIIKWLHSLRNPFRHRPSPVARVLHTPELLERILVHVPHQDLALHIPRTCKRFREAARTSPSLRRRLFLMPDYKCSPQLRLPLVLMRTSL